MSAVLSRSPNNCIGTRPADAVKHVANKTANLLAAFQQEGGVTPQSAAVLSNSATDLCYAASGNRLATPQEDRTLADTVASQAKDSLTAAYKPSAAVVRRLDAALTKLRDIPDTPKSETVAATQPKVL